MKKLKKMHNGESLADYKERRKPSNNRRRLREKKLKYNG